VVVHHNLEVLVRISFLLVSNTPPFQIVSRFGFYICIAFVMYLDIHYVYRYKVKTMYLKKHNLQFGMEGVEF